MARITIIPSDGVVIVDGNAKFQPFDLSDCGIPSDVHALQWFGATGWVEFVESPDGGAKRPNQEINALPAWAESCVTVWETWVRPNPPPPPTPTAEDNKRIAEGKLYETDWTQIPSVSDPALSNPHLLNAGEFAAYRVQIRDIAMNPVAGFIDWPTAPSASWSA